MTDQLPPTQWGATNKPAPAQHLRFGSVGPGGWRAFAKIANILNNQTPPTLGIVAIDGNERRSFVIPRGESTKVVWQVVAPSTVDTYTATLYRLCYVQNAAGEVVAAFVSEGDAFEIDLSTDAPTQFIEQAHYGDPVLLVITDIVLGTGSLPFAADEGFSLLYRSV